MLARSAPLEASARPAQQQQQQAAAVVAVAETEEESKRIQLPSISDGEAEAIKHYMSESGLSMSEIHRLEGTLRQRLSALDALNIRALYTSERESEKLLRDLEHAHDLILGMSQWMRHHDRSLNRMKVGIAAIEQRNQLLDLQERNHGELAQLLTRVFQELDLDSATRHTLLKPQISTSRSSYMDVVEAAHNLNTMLDTRLNNGLERLQAVKEKRGEMDQIRRQFSEHAFKFFIAQFSSEAGKIESSASESPSEVLISHSAAHNSLSRFEELSEVLELLAADVFVALRRQYTSKFQAKYQSHFRFYFSILIKSVPKMKTDCSLKHVVVADSNPSSATSSISSRMSGRRTLRPPSQPVTRNSSASEAFEGSVMLPHDTTSAIASAFHKTLIDAIAVIMEEQEFCMSFFGVKQEPQEEDAAEIIRMQNESATQEMLQTLFQGLQHDLLALLDRAAEMSQLNTVEILVHIEMLMQPEKHDEEARNSLFLQTLLQTLHQRASKHFSAFTNEQVAWIEGLKPSPKRCGVLSPFRRFSCFVYRLQAASERASDLTGHRSPVLDASYQRISQCMFDWLHNVAKQDAKYTSVVLMENAFAFWSSMSTSSADSEAVLACLSSLLASAFSLYQQQLEAYVKWSIQYALPEICAFFDLLSNQSQALSSALQDVPFTPGLSKHDLRALLKSYLNKKKLAKRSQQMLQRLHKHLGTSSASAALVSQVWQNVRDSIVYRFEAFDALVQQCYQSEELALSSSDIALIFSSGAASALNYTHNDPESSATATTTTTDA